MFKYIVINREWLMLTDDVLEGRGEMWQWQDMNVKGKARTKAILRVASKWDGTEKREKGLCRSKIIGMCWKGKEKCRHMV